MASTFISYLTLFFFFLRLGLASCFHLASATKFLPEDGSQENSVKSILHFDNFVLFGQIHSNDECGKMKGCKYQLSLELGENVWLQDLQGKYYAFQLPTTKFSGLEGRISIFVREGMALWNQSFVIQDDIGAYRLDVDVGKAIAASNHPENVIGVKEKQGARSRSGGTIPESRQVQFAPMALKAYHESMLLVCAADNWKESSHPIQPMPGTGTSQGQRAFAGSIVIQEKGGCELEVNYPWQLILYSNRLQTWHLACFLAYFSVIQLAIGVLQKSIVLLEAAFTSRSLIPVEEISKADDTNIASWQLCASNPIPVRSLKGKVSHVEGGEDTPCVGEGCFQEAWYDAERYLNKAIHKNCQGAYFSYNCIIPSQERQNSSSGRWNRNNAGRLIRELLSVNY